MLCDGRFVCGCADPYGKRVLGDARVSTIHEVWTGPIVSALRADLNDGGSRFCGDCPLKLPLKKGEPPVARPVDAGAQHAWLQEMLHAAVHSMYIRDGNGPASSGRTSGGSSFFSGSLSGQSPQKLDPPPFSSPRSVVMAEPLQTSWTEAARTSPSTRRP